MIDFAGMLYGPNYDAFGKPAVLTLADSELAITVIFKQMPLDESFLRSQSHQRLQLQSASPGFSVQLSELVANNIGFASLIGGILVYGGKSYRIEHYLEPGIAPDGAGELYLVVIEL